MAGGRPKKPVDYAVVEAMASVMCTQEEIAEHLVISVRTLQRNAEFRRVYKKGQEYAKASLRRMQWKTAQAGNVTMQIWLGKNYLDQSDKSEREMKEDQENVSVVSKVVKDFLEGKAHERNRS